MILELNYFKDWTVKEAEVVYKKFLENYDSYLEQVDKYVKPKQTYSIEELDEFGFWIQKTFQGLIECIDFSRVVITNIEELNQRLGMPFEEFNNVFTVYLGNALSHHFGGYFVFEKTNSTIRGYPTFTDFGPNTLPHLGGVITPHWELMSRFNSYSTDYNRKLGLVITDLYKKMIRQRETFGVKEEFTDFKRTLPNMSIQELLKEFGKWDYNLIDRKKRYNE
ncbi:MAG: hypothetical protein H6607_06225 [Flavobacteriales bacterium]|nr:hypothetical protein [Flavobacteriales bacterium]